MSKRKQNKNWVKKNQDNNQAKISKLIDTAGEVPVLRHEEIIQTLSRGDNSAVSNAILHVLKFYAENTLQGMTEVALRALNSFVNTVFAVLAYESFQIPKEHVLLYVSHCHIFAYVVAMSLYETTDATLQIILGQQNNLAKVAFLYSVRNKLDLPVEKFFETNLPLASRWYISAMAPCASPTTALIEKNMKRFYKAAPDNLIVYEDSCHISYFASSYINDDLDKVIKPKINAACKRQLNNPAVENTPNPNKIALVTSKWFPNSAVCKSARPLIERLLKKYHVTLVHTGPIPKGLMTDCFDEVIYLKDVGLDSLFKNDFQMIYYADIGMTPESVLLSNLRLAPVQVMSYGHPASTFGSEIDYFLGGEAVEKLDKVAEKYSERMVLIPGMGCLAAYPNYERRGVKKDHEVVNIQAVWGPDKYNFPSLQALKRAYARFEKPAKFHFYPSISINRNNAVLPFVRDLRTCLGGAFEIFTQFEYFDYMASAEDNSDMAINSPPPFGGFNTCVEAMYLDLPVLHCNGDTFRTMVGGVLNERVGMSDWNTNSLQEWEDKLVEIVNTGDWREKKRHLEELNLKEAIFSGSEPEWFEKAIDYLMVNGSKEEVKKDRSPLIVREVA